MAAQIIKVQSALTSVTTLALCRYCSACPLYCVQSESQSCSALYELEEVEAGLMHSGLTSALLSASYRPLQTVPVRAPTGVGWGYTGGAEIPLI